VGDFDKRRHSTTLTPAHENAALMIQDSPRVCDNRRQQYLWVHLENAASPKSQTCHLVTDSGQMSLVQCLDSVPIQTRDSEAMLRWRPRDHPRENELSLVTMQMFLCQKPHHLKLVPNNTHESANILQ